jgi:hypothetical protein
MPSTFGRLKPVILLPASCLTGLSAHELEAIILHELAHIKRNDYLWGIVMLTCKRILWFNPFAHLLIKQTYCEAENACDDFVLQFEYKPREYAFALLTLAKCNFRDTTMANGAGGNNQFELLYRISRLLNVPTSKRKPNKVTIAFSTLALFISVLIFSANLHSDNKIAASVNTTFASRSRLAQDLDLEPLLLQTRLTILNAAIGKNKTAGTKAKGTDTKMQVNDIAARGTNKPEPDYTDVAMQSNVFIEDKNRLFLSTSWVEENMESEDLLSDEVTNPWQNFSALIEKLDYTGKLTDDEWQAIMQYIAIHSSIREAIVIQALKLENPLGHAVHLPDQSEEKVLMIVYDEESGTLAASMVAKGLLNERYNLGEIPVTEQQVIFLNKKAINKSGRINL